MRNPWRSAFRCDPLPGSAHIIARSQPCSTAYDRRLASQLRAATPALGNRACAGEQRHPVAQAERARGDRPPLVFGEKQACIWTIGVDAGEAAHVIADCGLRIADLLTIESTTILNKSAIRNPQSAIESLAR